MKRVTFGPLISADELATQLGSHDLRLIDIRWSLADPGGGRKAYEAGHIPGAVFVDLEEDITGAEGAGRHPLPTREQFETAMRRAGVGRGDRVVIYDDAGGSVAARVWWLLRLHGHATVAVLDGGMQTWTGRRKRDPR
jgi:thiosulfate/3-mercaptopyruvate sulfurtransferase